MHLFGFIVVIFHDARSPERRIPFCLLYPATCFGYFFFTEAALKITHKIKSLEVFLCHTLMHGGSEVSHLTTVYSIYYCVLFIHVVFQNIEFHVLL